MKKEHQHKMKRVGMTLYCGCGFSKRVICAHRWNHLETAGIEVATAGRMIQQTRKRYECKICGAIQNTNTTTGETTITL